MANGVESEPASGKDKLLLGLSPHLVLDGVALAAAAVGASQAYLCVHSGHPQLAGLLRTAVTERERAGLNRVPIQLAEIPGGYVASQETALISFLNGGAQRPAFVPPRPPQRGVHGRPTLVQNVETLAHLALIARYGATWFRSVGDAQPAGSALVTVSGAVRQPSVLEIEPGTRIGELLERAGGPAGPPQAVLAGGYFGGWLPCPDALNVPVSTAGLGAAGAAFGPGILVLLPESACGLAETARMISYLASQSAGQCGPCLNGLPALAAAFGRVAFAQPDRATMDWARQLLALVAGRGACQLPDGTAALAASALRVFGPDLRRHAESGPCPQASRPPVLPAPGYGPGQRPPDPAATAGTAGEPPAAGQSGHLRGARGLRRAVPGADHHRPLGLPDHRAGAGHRRPARPCPPRGRRLPHPRPAARPHGLTVPPGKSYAPGLAGVSSSVPDRAKTARMTQSPSRTPRAAPNAPASRTAGRARRDAERRRGLDGSQLLPGHQPNPPERSPGDSDPARAFRLAIRYIVQGLSWRCTATWRRVSWVPSTGCGWSRSPAWRQPRSAA